MPRRVKPIARPGIAAVVSTLALSLGVSSTGADAQGYPGAQPGTNGVLIGLDQPASVQDKTGPLTSQQYKSQQYKAEQLTSEQLKSEQLKSEQLKSEQLKSQQLKSEQLKSQQFKSEQLKSQQLKF